MDEFAVAVIGAGPAGGQCARQLAQRGIPVLLVEQHSNFSQNNYSSAASPLETMALFDLPPGVVARYWTNLAIAATEKEQIWYGDQPRGVVFDFAKLRQFLADSVEQAGGQVWLGHRFLAYKQVENGLEVTLRRSPAEKVTVKTQVLIDATGSKRAVINYGQNGQTIKADSSKYYRGIGTEYLIRVDQNIHQKFADTLVFFLGYRWSPQGYSWIFPMDNQQLKVGTAIFAGQHRYLGQLKPIRFYTEAIIRNYLRLEKNQYKLEEIHGSVLNYAVNQGDTYHRGPVVAIGDAVSTVNFLGGEGIRHGMQGANIAIPFVVDYLQGDPQAFEKYEQAMKAHFAEPWQRTENLSQRVYLEFGDRQIDLGVTYLSYLDYDDVLDLLFHYRFDRIYGGITPLLLKKFAQFSQQCRRWLRNLRRFFLI
ncbi:MULTISPECIES: NAD(P)/FAD-dependent oxidoreductase [unclassified Synechocystis]|uniref:NAD(P)/FAD-dependent oxidoreductase n=1 Tax=unclassified Synechocystis TaxID=2640012 RepID=UPI00041D3DC4|nr:MULTISPECIES: NAD(P)/FAD-dependent oxidoreductase [unclassified Synechocystis]AIE75556.1 Geranylgeranyl hydrogenase, ChlP [Synechocystis sp. PCC 6714]MCT0253760.1 NAD(P)/FAD-dependent oxidoreductase [Synechocystis sp. CS-94]